jgi:hypothetical protein
MTGTMTSPVDCSQNVLRIVVPSTTPSHGHGRKLEHMEEKYYPTYADVSSRACVGTCGSGLLRRKDVRQHKLSFDSAITITFLMLTRSSYHTSHADLPCCATISVRARVRTNLSKPASRLCEQRQCLHTFALYYRRSLTPSLIGPVILGDGRQFRSWSLPIRSGSSSVH